MAHVSFHSMGDMEKLASDLLMVIKFLATASTLVTIAKKVFSHESDLCICEATLKAVAKKAQEEFQGFNGI